jgi:hypothetical protein
MTRTGCPRSPVALCTQNPCDTLNPTYRLPLPNPYARKISLFTRDKSGSHGDTYDDVRFQVLTASSMKFRVLWDILPCSQIDVDRRFRLIALIMEAARTSETSVDIDLTTRQYISQKTLNFTYDDGCLPGCCAVYSCRNLPTFQRFQLPPSSEQSSFS